MGIEVNYVIFSLKAYNKYNVNSILSYAIESPLANIAPPDVPGPFTFVVSIMLIGIEENERFTLQFIIRSKNTMVYDTGIIELASAGEISNSYIPKEFKDRFVTFKLFDVPFENEGKHMYDVIINGQLLKTGQFGVFQIPRGDVHE